MKNLFLLILGLLINILSFGQSKETYNLLKTLPKKSNIIVITTQDTFDIAFTKIANYLLDYGFNIESSDINLGIIRTSKDEIKDWSFKSVVNVRVKSIEQGTIIELKGTGYNSGFDFEAINSHSKAGINGTVFAMMYEVALLYDSNISLIKR